MSDMVPEVLNAALDSLFTPKEPGEQEYQGEDGLLYCRSCHTPVQCRMKLWGRDKIYHRWKEVKKLNGKSKNQYYNRKPQWLSCRRCG